MPIIYARMGFLFCTFYIPAAISRLQGDMSAQFSYLCNVFTVCNILDRALNHVFDDSESLTIRYLLYFDPCTEYGNFLSRSYLD